MQALKDLLFKKHGYEVDEENDTNKLIQNFTFHNKNSTDIVVTLTCGHQKKCKIGSLYTSAAKCKNCKNMDKYNYNELTRERTCGDCGYVHQNILPTNLKRFVCWNCSPNCNNKADTRLLKLLKDKGFKVAKNYRYMYHDLETSLTGDLYFLNGDEKIVVEIDDASHLSKTRKASHLKKDSMIIFKDKCKLIHIHKDDINSFVENIDSIIEMTKDHYILVYRNSNTTKEFYKKIYGEEEVRFIKNICSIEFVE